MVANARRIRLRLDASDVQKIAFDVILDCSAIPPFLEDREHRRDLAAYRVNTELVRYHQVGVPRGWVQFDGERHQIDPRSWYATRDHSWGVR